MRQAGSSRPAPPWAGPPRGRHGIGCCAPRGRGGGGARLWRRWRARSTVSGRWGAVGTGAGPSPVDRYPLPPRRLPVLPEDRRPRWPQQGEELLRVRGAGPGRLRLRRPGAVGAGRCGRGGGFGGRCWPWGPVSGLSASWQQALGKIGRAPITAPL